MKSTLNILPLDPSHYQKVQSIKKKTLNFELTEINGKHLIKLRAKKISNGRNSLYLHYRQDGKQEYQFLKIYIYGKPEFKHKDKESLKLAISIRDKKELALFENEYGFQLYDNKLKANFIDYFESVVQSKIKKDKTIDKSWKHTLKHLKIFSKNQPILFRHIDDNFCEGFKKYLTETIAPNTAHTYFAKLKASLNIAIKQKIIKDNPAQFIQVKKAETYREFLTFEELVLLKQTPCMSNDTKNAFIFSCFTGLRISDLRKLEWGDIKNGFLVFKQKKSDEFLRLLLGESALNCLNNQPKGQVCDLVFNLRQQ